MLKRNVLVIIIIMLIIGVMSPVKIQAKEQYELYKKDEVFLELNYCKPDRLKIKMPKDGYIKIFHEESSITIGVDTKNVNHGLKIYYADNGKIKLKKGKHYLYLLDGTSPTLFEDEGTKIKYKVYIKTEQE